MEHYNLQPDEVVLYKGTAFNPQNVKTQIDVVFTNMFVVLIQKVKKLFSKEQVTVEAFSVDTVKFYNETPQIKQNGTIVDMYFTGGERTVKFNSKGEAHKFVAKALEFFTGKNAFFRGIDKTKKTVAQVDDALGINTVSTASNILTKGIGGAILSKFGKKSIKATKETLKLTDGIIQKKEVREIEKPTLTPDEQFEAVKKLKELLDGEMITREEFEKKKKEIMGL